MDFEGLAVLLFWSTVFDLPKKQLVKLAIIPDVRNSFFKFLIILSSNKVNQRKVLCKFVE